MTTMTLGPLAQIARNGPGHQGVRGLVRRAARSAAPVQLRLTGVLRLWWHAADAECAGKARPGIHSLPAPSGDIRTAYDLLRSRGRRVCGRAPPDTPPWRTERRSGWRTFMTPKGRPLGDHVAGEALREQAGRGALFRICPAGRVSRAMHPCPGTLAFSGADAVVLFFTGGGWLLEQVLEADEKMAAYL